MSSPVRLSVALLASLVPYTPLAAQQVGAAPLDSGTLIRITMLSGGAVRGRLLEPFQPSTSSTLVFCSYPGSPCISKTEPHVQSVPSTTIATLEIGAGSHWLKGGLLGAGVGAALGGFFVYLANGLCDTSACRSSAPRTAFGLTAFGFGLGALFGSSSPRWKPAP